MRTLTLLFGACLLAGAGAGCGASDVAPAKAVTTDGGGATADGGGGGGDGSVVPPGPVVPPEFRAGVTVTLERSFDGAGPIRFGVPVPPGLVKDATGVNVRINGQPVAAGAREILGDYDKSGQRVGVHGLLVQLPASVLTTGKVDVEIAWTGGKAGPVDASFADVSVDSPDQVSTAVRTIRQTGTTYALVETTSSTRTLFTGKEPRVLTQFPDGYLAATGVLGAQASAKDAQVAERAGLAYLSKAMLDFGLSAMYAEPYALSPDPESVVDPVVTFEAWLYDRCASFLTAYSHTGDARFLRHSLRSCSYYSGKIERSGANAGIFRGKPDPDQKYSHLRGLFAYYALTGDEDARAAGIAMADMWLADPNFVAPYRQGRTRGPDRLWTERLLGTSLEGLYYGYRLTGDAKYLTAFQEMLATAFKHITGDQTALNAINPGAGFPPQNCFIHSAAQHAEGEATQPWCSIWMSELSLDVLLQYQAQFQDARVDEIFVRLSRFLRDVGSSYFTSDLLNDRFLAPTVCGRSTGGENDRRLVPLYGSGLASGGARQTFGEYDDIEHCTDATGLTAVALGALKHQGAYDKNPIGPFKSEGEALLQMHHEFSSCAQRVFVSQTRQNRNPATWTSTQLRAGAANPAQFIRDNKIGYPSHNISPLRKLGWWFNMSMLQFAILRDVKIDVPSLKPGLVQPPGCN